MSKAEEDDQVVGQEESGETTTLSKGQKKKLKQKQKAATAPEVKETDGDQAAAGAKDGDAKNEGDAAGDESEEEEGDGAAGNAGGAKKKKKKKKKAGGTPAERLIPKYTSDEEWAVWVKNALEVTASEELKKPQEELMKPPRPFWGYAYTGSLRPALVTPQMRMPQGFRMPDYATHSEGRSLEEENAPLEVPVLDGKNLETMRQACRYGREVLDIAGRFLKEGVTGDEIDRVVYQACVDRNIYPSPLNYFRFPKSVCVSPNEVICHGIPDCRPIEKGDIVNLDVSIYYNGFHSDLNETFFIGECDEDTHRLVRTAYNALHAACKLIHPGTLYRELGNAIHTETAKNNCSVVTTYCGHGVGALFHGPPKIPHYRKNKAVGVMKPGHVFTVEPMLNLGPSGADKTWPDDWTAVTKDGKRSSQFEHTYLVTETGVELLTARLGTDPTCMPDFDPAMFQR